jgi:DegV family protein with EDD domain
MPSIAIVTDTDSSLSAEVAARHGIRLVPIGVNFGEQSFETGVDIDDAALFQRIDREGKLPTTSAPTPGKFGEAYQAALDAGAKSVICFCVSSKVSAAYAAAVSARDLMPKCDITVVDSNTLSMGQGFVALAAAEAARAGASKNQILAAASSVRDRVHLFAALSTLRYLSMSGRVGHVTAGMATLLDVKPILTIRDGKLDMLERVRTQKRAWARVIELAMQVVVEGNRNRAIERMAILHAVAPAEARAFEQQIRSILPCPADVLMAELTPGLSVHAGAGLVGVTLVTGA